MRLIDIVRAPWAITPEMFGEVQSIYARHMRGEKIDLEQLEARTGQALENARKELVVEDGVAIISLEGVLAKRMNLFMRISGGTSMQLAANQVRAALADQSVKAIVLNIDSPGGTVDGTQDLTRVIFEGRDQKAIVAIADGVMASAAYWIGSAAHKVFISDRTTQVGSIGVVATHTDWSKWEEMRGIKTTEITAGKYKRIASDVAPLSHEGYAVLQAQVDHIYSIFVDEVSRNRGVDVDKVLADMADGRIFIGEQAIKAGLVDGVSTFDALLSKVSAGEFAAGKVVSLGGVPGTVVQHQEVASMTLTAEQVKKEHPEVAKALAAEGHTAARDEGLKAGKAEGIIEGSQAERERVQSVLAIGKKMPGHDELVTKLAFDGKTTSGQAAEAVIAAEGAKNEARLKGLQDDANKVKVPPSNPPTNSDTVDQKMDPHQVAAKARSYIAEQAAKGITVSAAEAVAHVSKEK